MGNCFQKPHQKIPPPPLPLPPIKSKKSLSEIAPADTIAGHRKTPLSPPQQPPQPELTLCGDPSSPSTHYLRYALLHKPISSLRYFPSQMPLSLFTLRFADDDPVSGPHETVLRYVESKLPHPPLLLPRSPSDETAPFVVRVARLQHRSMTWHVERVVRWGVDLATRGGKAAVDPAVGTPKMEVGKFGKSYGKLLEVLLEHAQMEERVVFPILQAADRGVCKCVNEEHARDLPIMNGIKEHIKSIAVLGTGTPAYREALHNLSARLKKLQENCKEHFDEEERNLFTLMEAAELTREQQRKVVDQCIDVMQGTHSHLFSFFIEGLLPHEAMEYLELLMNCLDKEKATSVLRLLVDSEG